MLVLLVTNGTRAASGGLLIDMERDTNWSRSQLSLAASLGLAIYGLSGPIAGALLRRIGIRQVTVISLTLTAVSFLLAGRVSTLWELCLWFGLVSGFASGLVASVLAATIANRWFVEKRGLVTGLFGASSSAGLLIFFPAFAAVGANAGWRSAITWMAVLCLIVAVPALVFMREAPASVGQAPYGGVAEPLIGAERGVMRLAARRPEFWLLAGTFMVCGGTSNGLIGQHFIAHATDHGFKQATAANWLAVIGIFNFIGALMSGWLTDRVDPRKLLMIYYTFRGVSLFFLPFVTDNRSAGVFAVLFGLDYIATVPPTIVLCADLFGRRNAGVVYGWVFAAHALGAATAAWAAGAVYDGAGSYSMAFSAAGAFALVAGFAATLIRRPQVPLAI